MDHFDIKPAAKPQKELATLAKNFPFHSTASLSLSSSSSSSAFTIFVHKLDISGSQVTDILSQSRLSLTSEQKAMEKLRTRLASQPHTKAAANHNSCRLNKVGTRRFAQSANTSRVVQLGNELLEERLASSAPFAALTLSLLLVLVPRCCSVSFQKTPPLLDQRAIRC